MLKFILKTISAIILLLLTWSLFNLFTFSTVGEGSKSEHQKNFNQDYKIYSLSTPKTLSFATEEVPLNLMDVRERLDRELLVNTYWQSQTMLFLKRAHRHFPIIEQILKANNVPEDFKYLALIESGLLNVISPAGATGVWQIMKPTGRDFGLEINNDVDERYHLEKATQAACEYLKEAYGKFGSWTLAAASYNMGMSGLENRLEEQKVNNYYDLHLNIETARYVYRILAVKQILEHPTDYGFTFIGDHLYPEIMTRDTTVKTEINDLAEFAKRKRINLKILKTLNPWLQSNALPNSTGKEYILQLPAGAVTLHPADTAAFVPLDSTQG